MNRFIAFQCPAWSFTTGKIGKRLGISSKPASFTAIN